MFTPLITDNLKTTRLVQFCAVSQTRLPKNSKNVEKRVKKKVPKIDYISFVMEIVANLQRVFKGKC